MFAATVTIYDGVTDEPIDRDVAFGLTVEGCEAAAGAMRRRMEVRDTNGIIGPTVEIKATTLLMAGCLQ